MYTPGKIPTALNRIHRNWILYPALPRDEEKYRTYSFCQFWRWNFYAILQSIFGIVALYCLFAGILASGFSIYELVTGGDSRGCFLHMQSAFIGSIDSDEIGSMLSALKFPITMVFMFGAASVLFAPLLVIGFGTIWLIVKSSRSFVPSESFKRSAIYNANLRFKEKFCPRMDYTDEQ